VRFNIVNKVKELIRTVRKPFSPALRQAQIDVVTKLTTGKNVLALAEDALDIAGDTLADADGVLKTKSDELAKAQVAHRLATTTKNLREKDFNTVEELLK
jgi:hypothetical protein